MDDIAMRIKELIDEKGLANGEFARAINVNPSIISHILNGRNKVSLQIIEAIKTRFTNVNLDYLLTGNGKLYSGITNVKSDNDQFSGHPDLTDSAFPMEGVRHAAIPGSAPRYTTPEEDVPDTANEKESVAKEPVPYSSLSLRNEEVEQVIIFYKDGSFKVYRPQPS
ncbi:MAG TPA: hypothetical protein DCG19_04105 [Cryomorphaceae bacterium]|nr:hypothetical protein [Owenweeksia sp.]MBF98853.1 hypothetical protein [Owenweeksia sp.]HAD96564.1 hypothetical protein [Cryomorphaceae bacterium]HBF20806.1 hypothetical protein [Cryomorphaceae bacterium]HCQ16221.1 hypothetical protein [Cryomorphaceae bacterium]|tara:strand:- start:546 stop:1046 length:501 start_codon:yes stop_codon:yes gene_type:complete